MFLCYTKHVDYILKAQTIVTTVINLLKFLIDSFNRVLQLVSLVGCSWVLLHFLSSQLAIILHKHRVARIK